MKRFTLILCASLLCCVCALAKDVTKSYVVKGSFSSIAAGGNVEVEYTPSAKVSVRASAASKEAIACLKVYVTRGVLHLETENQGKWEGMCNHKVKVVLQAPVMNSYLASGNSEINVHGNVTIGGKLKVNSSGNSEIEFKQAVDCRSVDLETSGNSSVDFDAKVSCREFEAESSGNSRVDIETISCDRMSLEASGNSGIKADCRSVGNVTANASGNSDIKLKGNIKNKSINTSGLAKVKYVR